MMISTSLSTLHVLLYIDKLLSSLEKKEPHPFSLKTAQLALPCVIEVVKKIHEIFSGVFSPSQGKIKHQVKLTAR